MSARARFQQDLHPQNDNRQRWPYIQRLLESFWGAEKLQIQGKVVMQKRWIAILGTRGPAHAIHLQPVHHDSVIVEGLAHY